MGTASTNGDQTYLDISEVVKEMLILVMLLSYSICSFFLTPVESGLLEPTAAGGVLEVFTGVPDTMPACTNELNRLAISAEEVPNGGAEGPAVAPG